MSASAEISTAERVIHLDLPGDGSGRLAAAASVGGQLLLSPRWTARGPGLLGAAVWKRLCKRAMDVVASVLLLVVLAPLLVLTALAVKATSRGSVFFVQRRVGCDGRVFPMLKFRSMYRDAESRLRELAHLNEADGPVFKIQNDPRITPVGRVIRKLSIDELPQLFNVLTGSMSLVGPRPPLPHEVETYTPHQRQRLLVKPGLTCTWQVAGRSDITFEQWVEMDLDYIARWTLWNDLVLLARTVPAVLSGRGAY